MHHLGLFFVCFLFIISCSESSERVDEEIKVEAQIVPEKIPFSSYFESLDTIELLTRLYDSKSFEECGNIVWEPNYADGIFKTFSYDQKLHTGIDTVLYYLNKDDDSCAVVIFGTRKYHKDQDKEDELFVSDCHFCGVTIGVALFYQRNNSRDWFLYDFEKDLASLGYFGEYKTGDESQGEIELRILAENYHCLVLRHGIYSHMGESAGSEFWYAIEPRHLNGQPTQYLKGIFSYTYYYDYQGLSDSLIDHFKSTVRLIPSSQEYSKLIVETQRGKVLTTETFIYDEFACSYRSFSKK